jgi:hypothetical protein
MNGLKFFACAAAALFIAALPLSAQGLMGSSKSLTYAVTINVNVANARVFADGVAVTGKIAYLKVGPHTIKVTADGYYEYIETINVKSPMTINAVLKTMGHQVTINSNIAGAVIYIDGAQVAGNIILLLPGNHSIRISAAGFLDYVSSVNVAGPLVINAQLKPAGYPVTINTNVANAVIYIDGERIAGNMANLLPGNHSIRITAAGFTDYVSSVSVAGPIVINAQLKPAGYLVTINTNVHDPDIFIDGVQIAGNAVVLDPGTHTVRISAPGYQDYMTSMRVTGPMTVNAQLALSGYPLTVTSDVKGAMVTINNVVKGPVPYTEYLPQGNYMVVVTAAGYMGYTTSVALNGPMTINAPLQSIVPATLSFIFPKEYLDKDSKDPHGQIKILIDGKVASVRGDTPSLKVQPGRHEVEVMSGGLVVQAMDIDFEAGTSYTFELYMELRVKASKY